MRLLDDVGIGVICCVIQVCAEMSVLNGKELVGVKIILGEGL